MKSNLKDLLLSDDFFPKIKRIKMCITKSTFQNKRKRNHTTEEGKQKQQQKHVSHALPTCSTTLKQNMLPHNVPLYLRTRSPTRTQYTNRKPRTSLFEHTNVCGVFPLLSQKSTLLSVSLLKCAGVCRCHVNNRITLKKKKNHKSSVVAKLRSCIR